MYETRTRVRKGLPAISVPSYMNPVYSVTRYFPKILFDISLPPARISSETFSPEDLSQYDFQDVGVCLQVEDARTRVW
jgi:hypothetical protein